MDNNFETKEADTIREYFKKWPGFYYTVAVVFGPIFFVGLSAKSFLKKYPRTGKIVNVGSGPRVLASGVINVDIFPYAGVSFIVEDEALPFEDASISRVIYDNVLEHIKTPDISISEASRVLERGGLVYISTPFLYPFHSSPSDFTRWTSEGLFNMMERGQFEVVESGARSGPFSVIVLLLCYFVASCFCFGNRKVYWFIVNASLFIFFPVKLFDFFAARTPFVSNAASVLYIVGRKK